MSVAFEQPASATPQLNATRFIRAASEQGKGKAKVSGWYDYLWVHPRL